MSTLISSKPWNVKNENSIITFDNVKGGWTRHLCIDGKQAYFVGGKCDSCEFLFERMGGANQTISPAEVGGTLRAGLTELTDDTLTQMSTVLPTGNYIASLSTIAPSLVKLGGENDYFHHEQIELWGLDPFWGLPHFPKVEYYRGITKRISDTDTLFEFVVPMVQKFWLDEDRVSEYVQEIDQNKKPTALCVSVLDVRGPDNGAPFYSHWCLTHYLLDGHHKTLAAHQAGKEITLLSFLAVDHSVAYDKEIAQLFVELGR